jgi:hypothetical protein
MGKNRVGKVYADTVKIETLAAVEGRGIAESQWKLTAE